MDQLLRSLRNVPLRFIGTALLVVGIALIAFGQSREGLVGQGPTAVPTPEPTPTLPSPTPTSPTSGVELLVRGFYAPRDEEPLVPTYTPDEKPLGTIAAPIPQSTAAPAITEPTPETIGRNPPATRLVIPALGIDAPVVEVPITNKTWDVSALTYEIAHLGGTANPGEKSNMVLSGHVTLTTGAGPFLRLESLEPGDLAIVYAGVQAHTYRVVSERRVGSNDVSVVYPTSEPILTLLSCTNWDAENRRYLERLVVVAKPVESEPGNDLLAP